MLIGREEEGKSSNWEHVQNYDKREKEKTKSKAGILSVTLTRLTCPSPIVIENSNFLLSFVKRVSELSQVFVV